MLVPYLNLSPDERIRIVLQELAEKRTVLTEEPTTFNGRPAAVLACKQWGVIVLGDQLMGLEVYPVCTENHIRVYQVTESAKLAQW
jgi:hypothetical protein